MNVRRIALTLPLVSAFAMTLTACQGSNGFAQLQETLAKIDQKQDNILARIDPLEEKVGKAPAAAPGAAKPQRPQAGRPDPKETYKVDVGDAATKGGDEALVTIVEWSDFQCPFCGRVNPTMAKIQETYGDKVRIAFKHNPLPMHNRAMAAAVAAEAAGKQGKFWEMHDKLFANPRELTDENFEKYATEIGLDVAKFKADTAGIEMDSDETECHRIFTALLERSFPKGCPSKKEKRKKKGKKSKQKAAAAERG